VLLLKSLELLAHEDVAFGDVRVEECKLGSVMTTRKSVLQDLPEGRTEYHRS